MTDKNTVLQLHIGETGNKDSPAEELHYAVYQYNAATEDGIFYVRAFIVMKNGYDVIVRFTRLHDYAGVYSGRTVIPLSSNPTAKLYYICRMLNFILVYNAGKYRIRHIFHITRDMMAEFFEDYALEKKADGGYKGRNTIEKCISAVTRFMANLARKYGGHMKVTASELYRAENDYNQKGRLCTMDRPDFQVKGIFEEKRPFKDLPTKAFEQLIPLAFRYAPEIAFAMCLQAFAGLRAGEAMNVRQESSTLGGSLTFTSVSGIVTKVEIDLKRVRVMRSDNKAVGRIKKPRVQCVYPAFLDAFCTAYGFHKAHLDGRRFEKEYVPMFPNRDGMAFTADDYRKRFETLVKSRLLPLLLKSSDPELRIYGQLLCENNLSPHSLRHWFTVQLVLRGEDIAGIQFWRGDKSPQSAFEYLQNKGDLVNELKEADECLTQLLMKAGEQCHG